MLLCCTTKMPLLQLQQLHHYGRSLEHIELVCSNISAQELLCQSTNRIMLVPCSVTCHLPIKQYVLLSGASPSRKQTALSSLPSTSCCNGNGSADSVQLLFCSLHSVNTVVHHAQLPQLDACSLQCRLDSCHAACGSGHSPIACAEDSTAVGEACRQGHVRAQREIPLLT